MREFKTVNKTFIKSNNATSKIFNRYLYCLIPFFLLIIIYNAIWGSVTEIINLLKATFISLITSIIIQYLFNLAKKEKNLTKLLFKDNIITISFILGLFSLHASLLIIVISSIISVVMKNILKNTIFSSSIYGILIIILTSTFIYNVDTPLSNLKEMIYIGSYNDIVTPYGTLLSYTLGLKYYISPILSILVFIYLFYKKSIKYNIVLSYLLTFIFTMLLFGLFNNMSIWYLFFQITTGNILFLSVFCLSDYKNTPTTSEGQIIYGLILGVLTCILRFIVPELSVIIPLIIGPLILTKFINGISFKLRYNKKTYYLILIIIMVLIILMNTIINIVF